MKAAPLRWTLARYKPIWMGGIVARRTWGATNFLRAPVGKLKPAAETTPMEETGAARNLIVGGGDKRASRRPAGQAPQGHGFWPRATELPGACPARSDVLTSACLIVLKLPRQNMSRVAHVVFAGTLWDNCALHSEPSSGAMLCMPQLGRNKRLRD